MAFTFKGGTHVEEFKNTKKCRVETLPDVDFVSIPMSQHIGAPATPVVKVGDYVKMGQLIGEVTGGLGCPVHASVSGTVKEIKEVSVPSGARIKNVVIENDKKYILSESVKPYIGTLSETSSETIIDIVRNAGITGMGGASFPSYAKIQSAIGKAEKLIVNCAECEPFITVNHRLLLEDPASVINGVKILLKALGVKEAVIAVEDNKLDAVNTLEKMLQGSKMISVKVMKTKYPQGDERQLIYALTGRQLPEGKLPADIGYVIFNCETCSAIFNAFSTGMPLISRRVTVDGDCIRHPKNLLVPIGASYSDLIEFCGGLKRTPDKIISGGPMMGQAQWDPSGSVVKGTSAILVFSKRMSGSSSLPSACIRCGICVKNCPMQLMPSYLAMFSQAHDYKRAEEFGVLSCVECGTCSYNCPGSVEIVQHIRVAKGVIRAERARVAKAKEEAKNK